MKKYFLFLCTLAIFMACSNNESDTSTTNATEKVAVKAPQTEQAALKAVQDAENALYNKGNAGTFQRDKAVAVATAYEQYIAGYPQGAMAAEYLFKSAEIYRSLKQFDKATTAYSRIHKEYNTYKKAPHSLFLLGFSYENDLKDNEKAKTVYEQFLKENPEHELADDVQFSLKNLGRSPEDIIKDFDKNKK
ncbi:MAG: tetratricopeptide repeat protein [Chitinophagales bacterium]